MELSWMGPRLLEIRSLKTTGVTTKDTGMENFLSKANLLLQKGAWAHGHSKHEK
jgi:hypothetical protein